MKINLTYKAGIQKTVAGNWQGSDFQGLYYWRDPAGIAASFSDRPYRMLSTGYNSIGDISHDILSAKFTHTLSPTTFYDASLEYIATKYFTRPPAANDRHVSRYAAHLEPHDVFDDLFDLDSFHCSSGM